jgi:hypothetical protein
MIQELIKKDTQNMQQNNNETESGSGDQDLAEESEFFTDEQLN